MFSTNLRAHHSPGHGSGSDLAVHGVGDEQSHKPAMPANSSLALNVGQVLLDGLDMDWLLQSSPKAPGGTSNNLPISRVRT